MSLPSPVADGAEGYLLGHTLGGEVGEHLSRLVQTAVGAAELVAEAGGDPTGPLDAVVAMLRRTADSIDRQAAWMRANGKAPPSP